MYNKFEYNLWFKEASLRPQWLTSTRSMEDESVLLNRAKGALIGLSAGDAVGTTLGEQLYVPEHSKS